MLLAYCCAAAVVAAAANNQNISHYDVLRVPAHATEDEILAAFDELKAALEQEIIDRDADVWFQQNKDQQIASKFKSYDADANGLLSRDEAAQLLAELGIELDGEEHPIESVESWRRKTSKNKEATFSSKGHLLAVLQYNSLRVARIVLGDEDSRREYDAVTDQTWYSYVALAFHEGIYLWSFVGICVSTVYVVAYVSSRIQRAPTCFRRCATFCACVLREYEYWTLRRIIPVIVWCGPATTGQAIVQAITPFHRLHDKIKTAPPLVQHSLFTVVVAVLLAWLVPLLMQVLSRLVPFLKRVLSNPLNTMKTCMRCLGGAAWGIAKTVVSWVLLSYGCFLANTHPYIAIAGCVLVVVVALSLGYTIIITNVVVSWVVWSYGCFLANAHPYIALPGCVLVLVVALYLGYTVVITNVGFPIAIV